ncbi:putative acyl-CoA dehydrogenase fadE25 [Neobacillus rhizosphaerae]|uniref:Acyl-CoA dehydrogenase fadE25 n=1 Tax=Neobacillus rhizosphaerae TaxID=2880965 RepID=A0ABM9ER98_9BACI|nr:acyl-CoA dehydrogenase family protein [Neobacillus rhizosphaerae]CAH2715162.1 putative acyl-CoA dehydrogenase fadE25 [Neobacillus rhizosphaerae]
MKEVLMESELSILKNTVKSFVIENVIPAEQSQKGYVKEMSEIEVTSIQQKAKEAGLNALGAKKDWGGAGLPLYARTIIYEEAAQHRLGFYHPAVDGFGAELPSLLENCSPRQIAEYVIPAVSQGKGCFIALWEEHEDNQIDNLTCHAVSNGDEWIINGHKSYIQKMDQSGFGIILVNCKKENDTQKPTIFILELNDSFEKKDTVLIDVQKNYNITFNDFRIKDNRRIGKVGEGANLMKEWLAESQILLSARCLGISIKALDYAQAYAKMRITRGKTLSEFPSIRTMIANGFVNLNAARLMVHDAANKIDNGKKDGIIAAQMAKLFATETAAKIIDDCLQIHGGAGFAGDLPIERWYKEIRLARLDLLKKETIIENIARSIKL